MRFVLVVLVLVVLFSPAVLAQVSHPAKDVTPGNFSTGDYRLPNGILYIGNALAGAGGNSQRLTLFDPLGAGKLYVTTTGVGVGTPTPRAMLDVQGDLHIHMAPSQAGLVFGDNSPVSEKWHVGYWEPSIMPPNGGLVFTESGVADGILTLEAGGNVGIGTLDPAAKLDVNGIIRSMGNEVDIKGTSPRLTGVDTAGTTQFNIGYALSTTNVLDVQAVNGNKIKLSTTAADGALTILNGGDVGIGTVDPSTKFDINGNLRVRNLASCDTVDTDANGNLVCGTDNVNGTGGGGSGSGSTVKTGTYTGNGASSQSIGGIGFTSDQVEIWKLYNRGGYATRIGSNTQYNINLCCGGGSSGTVRDANVISSLDANGFTVTNNDVYDGGGTQAIDFNENGVTYLYRAVKNGGGGSGGGGLSPSDVYVDSHTATISGGETIYKTLNAPSGKEWIDPNYYISGSSGGCVNNKMRFTFSDDTQVTQDASGYDSAGLVGGPTWNVKVQNGASLGSGIYTSSLSGKGIKKVEYLSSLNAGNCGGSQATWKFSALEVSTSGSGGGSTQLIVGSKESAQMSNKYNLHPTEHADGSAGSGNRPYNMTVITSGTMKNLYVRITDIGHNGYGGDPGYWDIKVMKNGVSTSLAIRVNADRYGGGVSNNQLFKDTDEFSVAADDVISVLINGTETCPCSAYVQLADFAWSLEY